MHANWTFTHICISMEAVTHDIYGTYIYLRLVNTKGVAPGKLRTLVSDCSFPSLAASSPLLEPEKDQNPLDLEPLPPIFNCRTSFAWVKGLLVVFLQRYCTKVKVWTWGEGRIKGWVRSFQGNTSETNKTKKFIHWKLSCKKLIVF